MDAFFASVEQLDDPSLRGKPVAVGGGGSRGVVAAASYEARKYGVRSAMPGFKAKNLCPDIIFVPGRFERYREVSKQIREIFSRYTDLIEPLSLDEAYLDVTENKKGYTSAIKIAREIRASIYEETGLTASAGVSINKFIAKVASDINKPNGIKVVLPDEVESFLMALPIQKFYGVGARTTERMQKRGLYNGHDLIQKDIYYLKEHFGKMGVYYYNIVRGVDKRQVTPSRVRKSIGVEKTFLNNEGDLKVLKKALSNLVDELWNRIEKANVIGRTIVLKVKYEDFSQITRSNTCMTDVLKKEIIKEKVLHLLHGNFDKNKAVRLLGVSVMNLSESSKQLKLLI